MMIYIYKDENLCNNKAQIFILARIKEYRHNILEDVLAPLFKIIKIQNYLILKWGEHHKQLASPKHALQSFQSRSQHIYRKL